MSELLRAQEIAYNFDETAKSNFGGTISKPEIVIAKDTSELLNVRPTMVDGALLPLIPISTNFSRLATSVGKSFGLLTIKDKKAVIQPGIITSRSTSDTLHFTYLNDTIAPVDVKHGLSDLQRTVLSGGLDIQDGSVGTEHSHSTVVKAATELGHTAMAIRALSDEATMSSVTKGEHIAHDWGHQKSGIAPILTDRKNGKSPGMFDVVTESGVRPIDFNFVELTPGSRNVALVNIDAPEPTEKPTEMQDSKLVVVGLGLLAAQSLHGNSTQDKILSAMDRI